MQNHSEDSWKKIQNLKGWSEQKEFLKVLNDNFYAFYEVSFLMNYHFFAFNEISNQFKIIYGYKLVVIEPIQKWATLYVFSSA